MLCDIEITNKFRDTAFFLFYETPKAQNGPSNQVFSNVFQTTDKVPSASDGSSTVQFELENKFYAIIGTSAGQGTGTRINTSTSREVALGPGGSVVGVKYENNTFKWDDIAVVGRTAESNGGFQIITASNIPTDNVNRYIGFGAADPNNAGKVIPVSTYLAEPSLNTTIYPKTTYYIATGDYNPGQIIDFNSIGGWVKLDFEGSRVHKAVLTLGQNGKWVDDGNQSLKNGVKVTMGPS